MPERVKVLARVRPFLPTDPADADLSLFVVDNSHICVNKRHVFEVDKVYRMEDDTATVFQEHIEPMIEAFLGGYNATVMAYGQTGTGKTYTISGIVPALMDRIINGGFNGRADALAFQYIEVYGELLRDLLQPNSSTLTKGLQVWDEAPNMYMDDNDGTGERNLNPVRRTANVTVPDAVCGRCQTLQDALQLVERGARRRATAATSMNEDSSRSHSILTIINTKNNAKLNLVDLAGSERNKKTHNTGQRFKESIAINTGLLALGNVIRALHHNHAHHVAGHVPYRSSKLTRLLQDSFGGNSKTLFIACIAPDSYNSDESLRTLQYCALAKKILNEPLKNTEVQLRRLPLQALESESEMVPVFSAEQVNAYEELCQYCLSQEDELEDLRVELGTAQERLSLCEEELRNDEAVFTRQINEIKRLVARNKELERRVAQLERDKAKENRENVQPTIPVQKAWANVEERQTRPSSFNPDTFQRDEQMAALAKEALLHQNQNAELRNRLSGAVSLLDAQRRESALLRLELNEINALLGENTKST